MRTGVVADSKLGGPSTMRVGATSAVRKLLSSSSLRSSDPAAGRSVSSDVSSGAVPKDATSALDVGTCEHHDVV